MKTAPDMYTMAAGTDAKGGDELCVGINTKPL